MGDVWLAEQTEPVRRRVALKVIKLGMDTAQVVARFAAERQALALMDHPAVAKVFEAGSTPRGRPYFVMEHVRGVPITEYCDRHKLETRERLALFAQVCAGVQHAHQKAILHRDLKPSNVLVTEQDGKLQPKIIDFGVAKATAQRLTERTVYTELGVLIGTPEYMSSVLGADHPDTLGSFNNMGFLLSNQGKLAEAEDYFREALEGRRRVSGADHPHTALSLANLAGLLNKQRRFAEAEPLLREALEIYPKQLDAGHWWIAQARSQLGESLAGLGRHAEAEPLLLEGQRALEASTEATAKHTRVAVERIVTLYATWGRRDDEARWRAKLAELP